MIPFGACLFNWILVDRRRICEQRYIGNNEVPTNESLMPLERLAIMHELKDLDSWIFILDARIEREHPHTSFRMLWRFSLYSRKNKIEKKIWWSGINSDRWKSTTMKAITRYVEKTNSSSFFAKQDINKRNSSLHKLKILSDIRINQLVWNSKLLKRLSRTLSAWTTRRDQIKTTSIYLKVTAQISYFFGQLLDLICVIVQCVHWCPKESTKACLHRKVCT